MLKSEISLEVSDFLINFASEIKNSLGDNFKNNSIMEFTGIRTAKATNGKKYTFKVDKNYYTPEKDNKEHICNVAKGFYGNERNYAVLYTEVKEDKGWRVETHWGHGCIVDYDNGLVGYQQMGFYKTYEEAKEAFESQKKVVGKLCDDGTAFADVFLVSNILNQSNYGTETNNGRDCKS